MLRLTRAGRTAFVDYKRTMNGMLRGA
jgi:ribosomal protein L30/L7E